MATPVEREELRRRLGQLSEEDLDAAERLLKGLLALRGNLRASLPVGEPLSPFIVRRNKEMLRQFTATIMNSVFT